MFTSCQKQLGEEKFGRDPKNGDSKSKPFTTSVALACGSNCTEQISFIILCTSDSSLITPGSDVWLGLVGILIIRSLGFLPCFLADPATHFLEHLRALIDGAYEDIARLKVFSVDSRA